VKSGLAVETFNTLILAGGGNRCWWQAGVLSEWMSGDRLCASRFAGTSAGAGIATAALGGTLDAAIAACRRLYGANRANFDRARREFAHRTIYPEWVASLATANALARIRAAGVELQIGVARLPRPMPRSIGVGLGMLAYLVDKYVMASVHPRLPTWFGYRMELHRVHGAMSEAEARNLLEASAAAPPFMALRKIDGRVALDGGLCDNAPRVPTNASDERQLVLLTRHYPRRPRVFEQAGRWYMQPSRPVPVSTWDCTWRTDIGAAIALGRADARAA
jgi:predicted acylesterase/phospholipase RssA